MIRVVESKKAVMKDRLVESKEVLRALLDSLTQSRGRLWLMWNVGMLTLLNKTVKYSSLPVEDESLLKVQWTNLVTRAREGWERVVQGPILEAEEHDLDELAELEIEDEGDEFDQLGWLEDEGNEDDMVDNIG
jgi:hypothetical protein